MCAIYLKVLTEFCSSFNVWNIMYGLYVQVKIIEQNIAAQDNIINRLTSLYASYGESRRLLTDVLRKREGLINGNIFIYFLFFRNIPSDQSQRLLFCQPKKNLVL